MHMRISITYPSAKGSSHGNAEVERYSMQYHVDQPYETCVIGVAAMTECASGEDRNRIKCLKRVGRQS